MIYQPLKLGYSKSPVSTLSTMSPLGMNKRTAQQFLDTRSAIEIVNYDILDYGNLQKRGGLEKIFEVAGGNPITMLKKWTDDVWIFGFKDTVAQYRISTNSTLIIKNNFDILSRFCGVSYGEYFFVCNGIGKIWRIAYSDLSTTEIANSPTATVGIVAIGSRLFSWNGVNARYSEVDSGSNPPFTTWNIDTAVSAGGQTNYRNAGDVKSIVPLGEAFVVFSDKGFYTFTLTTIDSAGVLKKVETITKYQEDFGGAQGAINTPIGIFYVNESGLTHMTALGTQNVPYSKQERVVSRGLGNNFWDDVNFDNIDIAYDIKKDCVYVTCAKNSGINNTVIVYNAGLNALSLIENWNISRFMRIEGDVYGASSIKTAVYKLFSGDTDDGLIIGTKYSQEIKIGDLETRQDLIDIYTQGFLSPSSLIKVRGDVYSESGIRTIDKFGYDWTAQYAVSSMDSYNSARYSSSTYGGDIELVGLVECFDGCKPLIRNIQRLVLNITSNDVFSHRLVWIKVNSRVKTKIRRRKMLKAT